MVGVYRSHVRPSAFFLKEKENGLLPITHEEMTRFSISLQDGVNLVMYAIEHHLGGEIFVPKINNIFFLGITGFASTFWKSARMLSIQYELMMRYMYTLKIRLRQKISVIFLSVPHST